MVRVQVVFCTRKFTVALPPVTVVDWLTFAAVPVFCHV
jgi:hypothetical protein